MSSRLRRFLHLEQARPSRPEEPAATAGVDARFEAVLRGVDGRGGQAAPGDDPAGDGAPSALPLLRWLRRRWW